LEIIIIILLFILGLFLVSKGGDFFLNASVWIAETFHIPKVIVGATIVTIGTTLPEMIVSVSAAIQGNTELAASNAVGSITVNIGLILSILVLFHPFTIKRTDYTGKILLTFLAILALLCLGWDGILGTVESILLIAIFAVFIFVNIRQAKSSAKDLQFSSEPAGLHNPKDSKNHPDSSKRSVIVHIIKFLLGAGGIYFGSQFLIDNGVLLAKAVGIPEVIIGFTAVSIGTSLPELVCALKSIRRGNTGVSVGNIIGANIVDTSLILSLSSIFSGGNLPVPEKIVRQDMPLYIVLISIIFVPALLRKRFSRWQAILTSGIYIFYVAWMLIP
jgi:cation:H+ antiporter